MAVTVMAHIWMTLARTPDPLLAVVARLPGHPDSSTAGRASLERARMLWHTAVTHCIALSQLVARCLRRWEGRAYGRKY